MYFPQGRHFPPRYAKGLPGVIRVWSGHFIRDLCDQWCVHTTYSDQGGITAAGIGNLVPSSLHEDVIKWKHFPRYWPFVRGIHRSPVNSPHKGQRHGALMFSLICTWTDSWANNGDACDLRCYRAHYDVIVMHRLDPDCQKSVMWT